jgi:hypothetical protein
LSATLTLAAICSRTAESSVKISALLRRSPERWVSSLRKVIDRRWVAHRVPREIGPDCGIHAETTFS